MKQRRMEPVSVGVSKSGHIRIAQDENQQVIVIHPSQVDLLIQWLQEVKTELLNGEHDTEDDE